jgi:fatty-acid desaturase
VGGFRDSLHGGWFSETLWRLRRERREHLNASALAQQQPWKRPWWYTQREEIPTLVYILGIHPLALLGLVLFPMPGWPLFLFVLLVTCLGGLGTTVGYHRALAHRAVTLHPFLEQVLIFLAIFNGSGSPLSWVPNHRQHHSHSDTMDDVSSPSHGGFWWAHLRWLYQWPTSPVEKWSPDLARPRYRIWTWLQPPIVVVSLSFGYALFGWPGFFWLGAIRLVYSLHGQATVNSILHMKRDAGSAPDSSQNVWWVGPLQLTAWGENWHENHHRTPWCAKFSRRWWQVDIGWYTICGLEAIGFATKVRRQLTDVLRPGDSAASPKPPLGLVT